MRLRPRLLALVPFFFSLPLCAQTPSVAEARTVALSPDAAAIVAASRESNRVMAHADYLTNAVGPRLTGSESLVRACEWAASEFERFGLQNVHLEKWGEVPVTFERGPWFGAMLWQDGDVEHRVVLEFNTPSWSAGTKGLRRGRAIALPTTEEEFAKVEGDLRGAWVIVPPSSRGARGRRGAPGGEEEAPRFDALRACENAGILGTVTVSRDEYLRTGASRRVNWRQVSMDDLPQLVEITLVPDQFETLTAMLGDGAAVDLEFLVQNRFRPGPVPFYNVVADIPGTEKPDEFVLVGGHIDCWDGANGACDNASGCATAMEAARLIMAAGVKPKRTIRFVLWSGEEQGLLGSAAYVRQHESELPKISAYLNHDSGTNTVSGLSCTEAMKAALDVAFAGADTIDSNKDFEIQVVDGLRGGGSDHSSFIRAGVPAWSWRLSGDHPYGHIWHTQHDLYDEIVEDSQRHSAVMIAVGAVGIADLDGLLSREKMTAPGGGRGGFNVGIEIADSKVVSVQEDGLFATSGFKAGDKILKAGDQEVADIRDLFTALRDAGGEPLAVTVLRDGKEVKFELTLPTRRRRR